MYTVAACGSAPSAGTPSPWFCLASSPPWSTCWAPFFRRQHRPARPAACRCGADMTTSVWWNRMWSRMMRVSGCLLSSVLVTSCASFLTQSVPTWTPRTTALERPSAQEIARRLRVWWVDPQTREKQRIRYVVNRGPKTILDGRGGALTVVTAWACCGDGTAQGEFFWHNRSFIGMASRYVTDPVLKITSPRPGTIVVVFAGYKRSDPRCCPTGPPVRAVFHWKGRRPVLSGRVPHDGIVFIPGGH